MNDATALAHTPFVNMLTMMSNTAETPLERELSKLALDLYLLSSEQPRVINFVNEWALRVMT
jgi:hypothetical protein